MKKLWLVLFFAATLVLFGSAGSATSGGANVTGDPNSSLPNNVTVYVSGLSAAAADVEGVTIKNQQSAQVKPGYSFRRESKNSLSVWKTLRDASFQTGTLTCVRPRKGACSAEFSGDYAKCSSACYFVGVRGGTRVE